MRPAENMKKLIKNVPVNTNSERDKEVLNDVLDALEKSKKARSTAVQPNVWRIIMRNRMTQYAVAAVIILVIIIGFIELGKPVGASVAFAAAMDNIKQARTFSCTGIFQATYQNGEEQGKYLLKQKWMFKEPDRERHETLTSPWPRYVGETTIMDYGKRQQLELRPVEKTATLHDMSSDYEVDDKTGELKLTQLSTRLRDRLLEWSAGAVEDLGKTKLDSRTVRMLQSHKENRITTVWIDPETNFPIQIELKWTDQSRSPVMYTSIQIDTELDDDLFSLEPPEGYAVRVLEPNWSDEQKKMLAKMRYLSVSCFVYADKHNDQFPGELDDLLTAGIVTDDVLRNVLAAPDEPDGQPVIRYRQPGTDVEDRTIEVMLYEIYDRWPDVGAVMCFADGHCEIIPDQNRYEELIK